MNKSEIKKELIDFLTMLSQHEDDYFEFDISIKAKSLLISINSDAQVESRSVGENEQTRKTCRVKMKECSQEFSAVNIICQSCISV